ncbi:MAG: methyltransferase domain-containing protein [Candidatus Eisenbacteria bacterium]
MRNPWLEIPLSDYESHMSLPNVGQAEMLASEFAESLRRFSPESVAVIGCAGGNGFDRIPSATRRVVGVDINPDYIASAASRYARRIPGLELYATDIEAEPLRIAPVQLIYAALVFEYVSPARALGNLVPLCCPGGRLVAVLQLESQRMHAVTPSPYQTLQALAPVMRLVSPEELTVCAASVDFAIESAKTVVLDSGKQFAVQVYRHAAS